MSRFVVIALVGIALLLAGSLVFLQFLGGDERPERPAAVEPPPVAPPPPQQQRPAVVAPPPAATSAELDAFLHPPPKAVPAPEAPPPPVDLARDAPSFEARVSSRCGALQLRLGDEMRRKGEEMTGQALLLFPVETLPGQVKLGQGTIQSPGNVRPGLVSCALWALSGQVFPASGVEPGKKFTAQVVLGMRE
ncbi:MAG: hypothetical protein WB493_05795 [Anaeromyxobacteraceae bacterium]